MPPRLYIQQSKLPTRGEVRNILVSCAIAALLMSAIYWLAFHSGLTHSRAELLTSGQQDIRAGLERIERQNAVAYAVSEDSKTKAVESARRMRELADTMQPNPFQRSK